LGDDGTEPSWGALSSLDREERDLHVHARAGGLDVRGAYAGLTLHVSLSKRDKGMLKITSVVSAEHETTLQLDGSVAGEWIELLRSLAESELGKGTRLTLDLKNVSFIDCVGIALLKRLIRSGVNTVNPPLFVVEQIRKCNDAQVQ
jgi:ABC-type transporter Mla MlaB component